MTREQWLRNQIRSLEQHIRDEVNQARLSLFQDVLERQQKELAQWLSPDPEEYSPEMVRSDISATVVRLQALRQQPPSPERDSDIEDAEVMLAEHRELLANLETVVSGERVPARSTG